jgi:hypothetical protein
MIKNFNVAFNSKYFDQVYEYKGQWDVPSRCGLKIVRKEDRDIVFATELYAENPGTSVTQWCSQLAAAVCKDFDLKSERLYFIVHAPDTKSKLTFLNESFSLVRFTFDGEKFINPQWETITGKDVDDFLS